MKKFVRLITIFAVIICLSSCYSDEEIAATKKLKTDILGCWTATSDEYAKMDDKDNLIEFSCYEFTENEILFHILSVTETKTFSVCDSYEISNENEIVFSVDENKFKSEIIFSENGELIFKSDDETTNFRRLNDIETTEFYIPKVLE